MNAFASKCTLRSRYIVIYSDLHGAWQKGI